MSPTSAARKQATPPCASEEEHKQEQEKIMIAALGLAGGATDGRWLIRRRRIVAEATSQLARSVGEPVQADEARQAGDHKVSHEARDGQRMPEIARDGATS